MGRSIEVEVEVEVLVLVRRRGADPVADPAPCGFLVDHGVADYDERTLTSSLVPLQDRDSAARWCTTTRWPGGPLQRYLDDPTVEEVLFTSGCSRGRGHAFSWAGDQTCASPGLHQPVWGWERSRAPRPPSR